MVVYCHVIKRAHISGESENITRRKLFDFKEQIKNNRTAAEEN